MVFPHVCCAILLTDLVFLVLLRGTFLFFKSLSMWRKLFCGDLHLNILSSYSNIYFGSVVNSIFPGEDTIVFHIGLIFGSLSNIDSTGKLIIHPNDIWGDFSFSILNFPYLYYNIPLSPANGVYVSHLVRYAKACSTYGKFYMDFNSVVKSAFH